MVTGTRIDRLARSTFDLFGIVKRIWTPRRNSDHWHSRGPAPAPDANGACDMAKTPESGSQTGARRRKVVGRLVEEVKRFLVMFLYLWVLFGLFALYQRIILRQEGINFTEQGFALVNALVLGKVMLIAEDLKIGRRLRPRPLIYPILADSFIFAVLFIIFHVVEHVIIGLLKGKTVAASVPVIGGGGLAGLVSVAVIYFVALTPFFAVKHLSRELGEGRLKAMLFGTAIR